MNPIPKKVSMELVGLDGNAFALLGAFRRQAKRERWSPEEIDSVTQEAKSGDYNHLLSTLLKYSKSPSQNQEEEMDGPDQL
jgi:hypothetical protein